MQAQIYINEGEKNKAKMLLEKIIELRSEISKKRKLNNWSQILPMFIMQANYLLDQDIQQIL